MTGRTYRIGEAARLLKLEGYVLRFWETEFEQLRPLRTPKGQRLYSDADLVVLRRIRTLLHEQGMTIEGARRVLERECAESGDGKARTPLPKGQRRSGCSSTTRAGKLCLNIRPMPKATDWNVLPAIMRKIWIRASLPAANATMRKPLSSAF